MIFSDNHKVVLATPPASDVWSGDVSSDIVLLEDYNHVTFIIITGAAADNANTVTVQACSNVTPDATSEMAFKYRSITSGDTYGTLTDAVAGTGFAFTASTANQYHIVEVDASDIEADTATYTGVRVTVTEAGNETAQFGAIIAILSEPRHAKAGLKTAIA